MTFLDKIELRREIVGWIGDWGYGFLKGYRKGREGVLLEQLAARFGKLPAGVKARIKKADHATLAAWTVEVLTAETLERVFEQGAAPAAPKRRATARKRARRA